MIKYLLSSLFIVVLGACTTMTSKEAPNDFQTQALDQTQDQENESIDLPRLQTFLNMDRDPEDLGYEEKSFNSCAVGFGFSSSRNCRQLYFIVINFQLQCRDSNGTESSTSYAVRPIVSNHVKWSIGSERGFTSTNGDGFGQIRWISSTSPNQRKLRLTNNKNFLILTASDVRRIVTPRSWCESNY